MAPTIICVRHAQGYHNLTVENHKLHDPDLTPYGKEQCANLAKTFPYHSSVDLLVCSPLRRTIYTTLLGFQPDIERGVVPVVALPEAQETSDLPCDTGSDPPILTKEFEKQPVDLSRVMDGWNSKAGRWAPDEGAIEKRALEARQWMKARPEKQIVLVTHGGFLHWFTQDWQGFNDGAGEHTVSVTWVPRKDGTGADELWSGTGWKNVEYRAYQFKDDGSDSLVETAESREARRGTEKGLDLTEKIELTNTYERTKEAQEKPVVAKV